MTLAEIMQRMKIITLLNNGNNNTESKIRAGLG